MPSLDSLPKECEEVRKSTVRAVVVAIAVVLVPLLGTFSASALAETVGTAATKAFRATNASKQANCQELAYLIATPEQRKTDPAFAQNPLQDAPGLFNLDGVFEALAVIDAGRCLDDVRTETSDDLPAEYPLAYLRGACQNVRPHLASDQVKMFFAYANIDAVAEVKKYCKAVDAWK